MEIDNRLEEANRRVGYALRQSAERQEATMPDCPNTPAAQRLALSTEFLEHVGALRELRRLAAEREQCIRDVWAQMMALEVAPQRGQRAAGRERE